MALATYADLKAAIAAWNFNRADLPTADLIALAETRLNRDLMLRIGETETGLTGVPGSSVMALPAGFIEPIELFLDIAGSGRTGLTFVAAGMETTEAPGRPLYWTVDGGDIAFERPCDQAYGFTLRSLQALTALSDGAPTNWLLTNQPDLYLAACNVEAALYLRNADQAGVWQARYADALSGVNNQAHRSKANATLRADAALLRPQRFDIVTG